MQLWHFPAQGARCRRLYQWAAVRQLWMFLLSCILKQTSGCPCTYEEPCPIYVCHMLLGNRLQRFLQRIRTGLEEHPVPNVRGLNVSSLRHSCLNKKVAPHNAPPIWRAWIVVFMDFHDLCSYAGICRIYILDLEAWIFLTYHFRHLACLFDLSLDHFMIFLFIKMRIILYTYLRAAMWSYVLYCMEMCNSVLCYKSCKNPHWSD